MKKPLTVLIKVQLFLKTKNRNLNKAHIHLLLKRLQIKNQILYLQKRAGTRVDHIGDEFLGESLAEGLKRGTQLFIKNILKSISFIVGTDP